MTPIIKLSVLVIGITLASCSSSKFTSRKYTSGTFIAQHSNMKHNTIFADTTKAYAFLSNTIELKKITKQETDNTDREVILEITKSIIKKDSVFVYQKKGKDVTIVKICDNKNVKIILNRYNQIIKVKPIDDMSKFRLKDSFNPKTKETKLPETKLLSKLSLLLFFIPIFGVLLSIMALKKIKFAKTINPSLNLKRFKNRSTLALVLSSIVSLAFVSFVIIYFLLFPILLLLSIILS